MLRSESSVELAQLLKLRLMLNRKMRTMTLMMMMTKTSLEEIDADAIETIKTEAIVTEDSVETAIISETTKTKIRMSLKRTNLSVAALCPVTLGTPEMNRIHFKARTHTRWKTLTWTSTMKTVRICSMKKMEAADFKPEGETPREALGVTMRETGIMVATNRKETLEIAITDRGTNVRDDRPAIKEEAESPERV